ncbi:unnamed protein product [Echinostoma caproni]|uniref:Calcium release-activated calcium channel protein 1 n=1 Tax=Echinostoma caproni TaxID=27848 RepID=A0A183B1P5_9TREM|nr:unnamed protein product [Echinostoma caproni]
MLTRTTSGILCFSVLTFNWVTKRPQCICIMSLAMFGNVPDKSNHSMESLTLKQLQLSRGKLKASGRVSALLAGFAIVGIIEMEVQLRDVPQGLLIAYTVLISLLIAVHMVAVLISTCILPHLDSYLFGPIENAPHFRLRTFIEVAWVCSTVVGILLFLAVVVLACWIKFWHLSWSAALASTVIMIPALFVLIGFTVRFYYALTAHKVQCANEMMARLDKHLHDLADSRIAGDIESGEFYVPENVALKSAPVPLESVKSA